MESTDNLKHASIKKTLLIFLNRTLYFRLGGSGQYVELERLLYDGAVVLFSSGEAGSGVDLTKCYVDVLRKGQVEPEEKYFERVTR